jgi:hypothetical protein
METHHYFLVMEALAFLLASKMGNLLAMVGFLTAISAELQIIGVFTY